jgi:hypothetical protein
VPLKKRREVDAAGRTARELRRMSELLNALGRAKPSPAQIARARAHPEMERIAGRFEAINDTLEKGVKAGSVTRAQLGSIARNFAAVAKALEKGAGTSR